MIEPPPQAEATQPAGRRVGPLVHGIANPLVVSWLLVGLGLFLRLVEYLANPSIWNDEAELALNIINRSYRGLTHPLSSNQGAPIGFLFVEKSAVELFGPGSLALRLFPFLAALVLMFVFRSLAMRTLGGWVACVAVALVAVSPSLVSYSTDAKQYSGDATAVTILAWLTVWVIRSELRPRALLCWSLACAVLVWFSFPTAFAAGAGTLVLAIGARRNFRRLAGVACATLLWLASFGVEYLTSLRAIHSNGQLLAFWSADLAPANGGKAAWAYRASLAVIHNPLGLALAPLAIALLVAGAVALVKAHWPIGIFCVAIIGVTLVGGLADEYPVGDRMVLFLVPVAALLLAASLLLDGLPAHRRLGPVMFVLVVVVSASSAATAARAVIHPYALTSARQALRYAIDHSGPGDLVLIDGTTTNLYTYLHQTAGITVGGNVTLTASPPGQTCSPTAETAVLRPFKKVWMVFAPPGTMEPPSALRQYASALSAGGSARIVRRYPGNTGLILVDPRASADGAASLPAPSWEAGRHGCLLFDIFPTGSR